MVTQTSLCQAWQFVKVLYEKLLISVLDRENTEGNSVSSNLDKPQPFSNKKQA